MVPRHNVEELSRAPKYEKSVMGLVEKIYVLDKLHSSMSAVGQVQY